MLKSEQIKNETIIYQEGQSMYKKMFNLISKRKTRIEITFTYLEIAMILEKNNNNLTIPGKHSYSAGGYLIISTISENNCKISNAYTPQFSIFRKLFHVCQRRQLGEFSLQHCLQWQNKRIKMQFCLLVGKWIHKV